MQVKASGSGRTVREVERTCYPLRVLLAEDNKLNMKVKSAAMMVVPNQAFLVSRCCVPCHSFNSTA